MIITVDTGGTKTLVSSFDRDGKIGEQFRFPTPKNVKKYTKELRNLLIDKYQEQDVEVVVIALPGIIKNGVATWCPNLKWKNFQAVKVFSGIFGKVPILIENDARLAGLAETRALPKTPTLSAYITISTGIGFGIITNGHIDPAIKSEIGHSLMEYDGKLQQWEKFSSGHWVYKKYKRYARDITSRNVWNQIAKRISRGFLVIIPAFQPDVIIIGGSIGTYFDRYSKQLDKILKHELPFFIKKPRIIQAKHPEQAVIYGCYYYAIDNLPVKKA